MDRKISPFQIILLATFGAIGVGAILVFALATAGSSSSSIGPVVIWGTFDQTTVSTVLRAAADSDSRLSGVSYVQKNPATFETDLANALASGTGPDLIIMRQDEVYHDSNKLYQIPLTQLSQSQFDTTFVAGASPFLGTNGAYGVPILVDPLVLYWDQDMLATAGIPEPPAFWDQLPTMSEQITLKNDNGSVIKSAIALGEYQNIDAAKDILSMLIMQAGGFITTQDSDGHTIAALEQGGSSSGAAESALRFYTEFADPSKDDYTWDQSLPDARQAFAAGTLAMYIGYASEQPLIRATNPNLNFAIAAIPQLRGTQNTLDGGGVYALAVPKAAHNPNGALTVAYLLASQSIDSSLATALGIAPARRDSLAISTTGSDQLFGKMALIVSTWIDPDPSQTGPIFQAMIEDTDSGAAQVSDAIGRADQAINNLLTSSQ
jgi:multiple sugar transport system substrate-binding protein